MAEGIPEETANPDHTYYPPEGDAGAEKELACKQSLVALWGRLKECFTKARDKFEKVENRLQQNSLGKACIGCLCAFLFFCLVIAPITLGAGVILRYKDYFDEYQYHKKATCANFSSVFLGKYHHYYFT